MNRHQWAKMPCYWQTDTRMHRRVAAATTGIAIAALKLFIGLCAKAAFNPTRDLPSGTVRVSITDLGRLVGVSKPTAIRALRLLRRWGLVETFEGRPAMHRLTRYDDADYWTKIPSAHLYGTSTKVMRRIAGMSSRGKARRQALQLYLYLAAIINGASGMAKVSYDKMTEVLCIGRNEVSRAISLLVEEDLVQVRPSESDDPTSNFRAPNQYWLRGTTPRHANYTDR